MYSPPSVVVRTPKETFNTIDTFRLSESPSIDETMRLETLLYYRFGFTWSQTRPVSPASLISFGLDPSFEQIRKIFGDTLSDITPGLEPLIHCFIVSLMEGNKPSSNLWDLSPQADTGLKTTVNPVDKILVHLVNDKPYYFILPFDARSSTGNQWFLVTEEAVTALECLRRGFSHREDATRHLLKNGIAFTLRRLIPSPASFSSLPIRPVNPQHRPKEWRFTVFDYYCYQQSLCRLVNDPTKVRAALMQGGIIWRIVKEFLFVHGKNWVNLEREVLSFGSPDSPSKSVDTFLSPDGKFLFYDDILTEEDTDIICGVYAVSTGSGKQCARVSWWPKPSAWKGSGLNVGYWSPACESWFQRRQQMFQKGKMELRTATKWKSSLILLRKQAKIADTNEALVVKWIKENLLPNPNFHLDVDKLKGCKSV